MDQVLKQLGIEWIFSMPYHSQSNRKLEVFHKYLKPGLKKLCKKDPPNWDKYINQVLASYSDTKPCHGRNTFLPSVWKRPNFTLTPASGAHAMTLGDPDSELLNLEAHWLALAITKKILDENHFRTAQKTMDRQPPSFNIGDRVYFKTNNLASGTSNGNLDTELSEFSMMDIFCTLETKLLEKYSLAMWRM